MQRRERHEGKKLLMCGLFATAHTHYRYKELCELTCFMSTVAAVTL